ncbi:glycerol-3-phosphate acyltransferase [Litchfieldia salsa]|nr:glycerol-3-phosphate acyltransferase [Litchfieldia salsa]
MIIYYFLFSYLIGCVMFGFIVGKVIGRIDIRSEGSGNVGARNIGRTLGKGAFLLTLVGDVSKTVIVILVGNYLGFSILIQLVGFLLVIIGHIWPITLSFSGGKGIASFLGGILIIEPVILLYILGAFLICYFLFKSFTNAGLISITCSPLFFWVSDYNMTLVFVIVLINIIILYAHRQNIKEVV